MSDIVSPVRADDFTVSLRIRHPSIDPVEITRTLGLEPQHCWKAGEARRSLQGQPLEGSYHESFWTGEFRDLEEGRQGMGASEAVLLQAITQLRRSQSFLKRMQAEGATIELSVEMSGSGEMTFALSPQVLAMLARCGLSLVLKVQPETQLFERRKVG